MIVDLVEDHGVSRGPNLPQVDEQDGQPDGVVQSRGILHAHKIGAARWSDAHSLPDSVGVRALDEDVKGILGGVAAPWAYWRYACGGGWPWSLVWSWNSIHPKLRDW